jgi:periplasmic protein TonB
MKYALPLMLASALLLAACEKSPPPPKRAQTVKLLPDTPPPPPPKPEERPPEAKRDEAPQPKQEAQPQPEQQALRSDEAAGDGPGSGLVAGAVTQDYTNQQIGGAASQPSGDDMAGRLNANLFANGATRALNDYLARDAAVKRLDYRVRVDVWLTGSGALQRAELVGSTGDPTTDAALRAALTRFPGTGTPPPERMPQPMRLLVSNRLMG